MGTLSAAGGDDETERAPDASERPADPERMPADPERMPAAPVTGTAVWIDGTSAIVARWLGRPIVEHVLDDVPPHHRSTGHVRHDPAVRHGGGGVVADQLDRDRARHRADHLHRVAALVPETGPVLILGPASARLELARELLTADRRHHRARSVRSEASGRLTERELVARLRGSVGEPPGRRVVGRV